MKFISVILLIQLFIIGIGVTGVSAQEKPPIPLGCPGSTMEGPIHPDQLAVCDTIPLGCPGSTMSGPPSGSFDPDDCPYSSSSSSTTEPSVSTNPGPSLEAPDGSMVNRDTVANCNGSKSEAALQACLAANPIVIVIQWVINLLAAGVGVITVFMIVMGGIQYSTAGANPQAVAAAKGRIINAILALLMYMFIYAFLQWLVPGGIF